MKILRLFPIYILLIFIVNNGFAQSNLNGIVIDEAGNDLIGANVMLYKNGVLIKGTITNETGEFNLKSNLPKYTLKISYLGYQDVELTSEDFLFDNLIVLKENTYDLNAVVVVGYSISKRQMVCGDGGFMRNNETFNTLIKIAPRNWNFYPNPTQDYLKIDVENEMCGNIEVIDNTGKIVASHPINGSSTVINLENLIDGMYYLRYNLQGKQVENIGKVVKIR